MTNEAKSVYFALLRGSGPIMARWQSGDAADCKSVYAGSIPTRASTSKRAICEPGGYQAVKIVGCLP